MYNKYAQLLTQYCLEVEKGHRVLIRATYLAEPLLIELCKEISKAGGHPILDVQIQDAQNMILHNSNLQQLAWENPMEKYMMENFEGYLFIKSDFDTESTITVAQDKKIAYQNAKKDTKRIYMERTGNRSMKRSLCMYPTQKSATLANMTLAEYEQFVFNACNLNEPNPTKAWQDFGKNQQKVVDYLNSKTKIQYKGPNVDLTFTTQGRIWINSDGKTNMPSGEVYTSPVDDSMNGWIKYSFPSIYDGNEVQDVSLEVKDGYITSWNASSGKDYLDKIFAMDGTRRFGEAAIGTNYNIQQSTKNILFDEKIGGSVHLAIGEAYRQCNGINESAVHWDMITDMTGGEIYADDELCYKDKKFIIE